MPALHVCPCHMAAQTSGKRKCIMQNPAIEVVSVNAGNWTPVDCMRRMGQSRYAVACSDTVHQPVSCRAVSHKNDKIETLLHEEQQTREKLYLRIREIQSQLTGKEKDMAFLRAVVCADLHLDLLTVALDLIYGDMHAAGAGDAANEESAESCGTKGTCS